jgi:hypothetical protein
MIQNRVTGLYLDGMGRTGNGAICGQWGGSGSANQQRQIQQLLSSRRIRAGYGGLIWLHRC